jgi:methylated-DNA-[protein]-cysteine S-methyltransferase
VRTQLSLRLSSRPRTKSSAKPALKSGASRPIYAYRIYPSAIGFFALVWTSEGLCALIFPEHEREGVERSLKARFPDAIEAGSKTAGGATQLVPSWIGEAATRLQAQLTGADVDLSDASLELPLDLSKIPDFHARIYRAARKLRRGQTVTYGELAREAGSPLAARAVGQAMAKNPLPLIVPCHRVLAAGGRIGGFTAPGGLGSKRHLLWLEGVQ